MSLPRLGARLRRLEHAARRVLWIADVQGVFVRLMGEACAEIGLAPLDGQALCTGLEDVLHTLSPSVPAAPNADLQAVDAFMSRVPAAVVVLLDTPVTDPSTRYQLPLALSQAWHREALRRGGASGIIDEDC